MVDFHDVSFESVLNFCSDRNVQLVQLVICHLELRHVVDHLVQVPFDLSHPFVDVVLLEVKVNDVVLVCVVE